MQAYLAAALKQYGSALFRLGIYIAVLLMTQSLQVLQGMTAEQVTLFHVSTRFKVILALTILTPVAVTIRAFVDSSMSDAKAGGPITASPTTTTSTPPNP